MKVTTIIILLAVFALSCTEKQPEPQPVDITRSVIVTFLDNTKDTITLTVSATDEPYFDITQHRYGSVLNVIYHSGKNWDGTNVARINTIATNVKMFEEINHDTDSLISVDWSYKPWMP